MKGIVTFVIEFVIMTGVVIRIMTMIVTEIANVTMIEFGIVIMTGVMTTIIMMIMTVIAIVIMIGLGIVIV